DADIDKGDGEPSLISHFLEDGKSRGRVFERLPIVSHVVVGQADIAECRGLTHSVPGLARDVEAFQVISKRLVVVAKLIVNNADIAERRGGPPHVAHRLVTLEARRKAGEGLFVVTEV